MGASQPDDPRVYDSGYWRKNARFDFWLTELGVIRRKTEVTTGGALVGPFMYSLCSVLSPIFPATSEALAL